MADEPLTVLQAAFLEAVRPTPAGRRPRTSFAHPGVSAPTSPVEGTPDDHDCLHAAVLVTPKGERIWYPGRSHPLEGAPKRLVHHYSAHWPACPAAWCRLPASHALAGTMHDIPGGKVVLVGPNEAVTRG